MAYGQKTFRRGGKGGWDYQVKGPYGGFAMGISWRDYELQAFMEEVAHELGPEIQRIVAIAVKETLDDIKYYAKHLGNTTGSMVFQKIADSLIIERDEIARSYAFQEFNFRIVSEDGAVGSRGEELAVLYKARKPEWNYAPWIRDLSGRRFKGTVESSRAFNLTKGMQSFPPLGFGQSSPGIKFGNERMRPFDWEEEVDWHIESKIEERLMALLRERYGAI